MQGSSVIRVVPQACSENSAQVMNKVNEIGRSVTVFREPRKQTTYTKQRKRIMFR